MTGNEAKDLTTDVAVVGGGMVGATLAALLGEAGLRVAVLDARPAPLDDDTVGHGEAAARVSAITPVSERLLTKLGVWPWVAGRRATPYTGMQVWDGEGSGEVRFHADEAGVAALGHIVENDVILAGLERRLAALPNVQCHYGVRLEALQSPATGRRLCLADGRRFTAPLVVAADGARSQLRDLAEIALRSRDTGHVAVVTTVQCERSHGGVARQVFLGTGPLAFLPLTLEGDSRYCSIVWSTTPAEAERLCGLSSAELGAALEQAFDATLGAVRVVGEVHRFPLVQRHAERYVVPGLALIGDAAHTVHPLAGQGVNLGLMDAAVLAEEVVAAHRRGALPGDLRILSRYARRRRGDNTAMLGLMEGFRWLFGTDQPALRLARNLGLSGVDRLTPLKRVMMRQAIGERGRLPLSCR
ncbi:UbiH/UbiF/VisC/COQ6 family ubiquinone biosynthesis hydroxylase [Modicisalibacter coralii]|uniref:UbiH/UbiF/VisC/COQ6 family ubiquinone biosynthesis hydroxylase n=1 Tax=Modicisalibacter coralii TaxID=2304602 RepID=UPI00100B3229|nr:UbiH/UbiF/VisC/COQ6 family ubiquinone biosynthesis hydroxylase [Halomonas coralii]